MKSSNLVTLLKSFSNDEFKDFGKFVRSPYFNSRKDIIRYYIHLKKYHPGFDNPRFTKEKIFSAVYPARKFNNGEYLKLNSHLYQLGLEYFKHMPNKYFDEYRVLTELVRRNLGKQFYTLYNSLNKYIDESEGLDNLIYIKKIYAVTAHIRYQMNRDRQKEVCGEIIKRGNYFAYQSLMWIMIQLRDMTANFNSYNYPFEESNAYKFIRAVNLEKLVSEINYEDNRLGRYLKYYLYCLLILMHPDNELYFEQFKQSFQSIYSEVDRLEKNNYLARLQTYVMKHIQRGNMKYLNELISAYKFFFNSKGVFENDIIPLPPFRNSIVIALHSCDMDFANELINVYSKKLNEDYREDAIKLGKAQVYFKEKKFEKVLETLRAFRYKYLPYKFDVKQLLLKTYYENSDFDYLLSFCDSFHHLVNNSRHLSALHRKQFNNIISLTNQIANLNLKENKPGLVKLGKEISENNYDLIFYDKLWLLEKIDEAIN